MCKQVIKKSINEYHCDNGKNLDQLIQDLDQTQQLVLAGTHELSAVANVLSSLGNQPQAYVLRQKQNVLDALLKIVDDRLLSLSNQLYELK